MEYKRKASPASASKSGGGVKGTTGIERRIYPQSQCFFRKDYLSAKHRPNKELRIALVFLDIIRRTQTRVLFNRFKIIMGARILAKDGNPAEDEFPRMQ